MKERNIILQLRREGYSDEEISAICQNEIMGLDRNMVQEELESPDNDYKNVSKESELSAYFIG